MSKRKDFCDLSVRQQRRRVLNLTNKIVESDAEKLNVNVLTDFSNASFISTLNNSADDNIETENSQDMTHENDFNVFKMASNSDTSTKNDENFAFNIQNEVSDITYDIRSWIVKHNITRAAANDLLEIFRKHESYKSLPKEVRSLMKTPRNKQLNILHLSQEEKYVHFNLEENIKVSIYKHYVDLPQEIYLNFNIDGLPVSKSSSGQFWPILAAIVDNTLYTEPFPVGIYYGTKKPQDINTFLQPLVTDILRIKNNYGIYIEEKLILVKINAFICDAPARAFIAGIKNHTGYFACTKCICEGDFIENRVVFPNLKCSLRTDASFKNKIQPEHHNLTSILEDTGIGMVSQLPLDYMHLVCLGVMKKLLQFWIRGKMHVRIKSHLLQSVSNKYVNMRKFIPKEFARYPRSLFEIDRWKATEFRLFLLYTGPVLLKNVLPLRIYAHFLCLSVSIRILCHTRLCIDQRKYAHELLIYFVKNFGE